MESKLPARIDRATFDRLLQRAAELQAASSDIGEGVSEEEMIALGKEVGLPEQHLRQALLEERTRAVPAAPAGFVDEWFGRAELMADRVVQGSEAAIAAALSRYLEAHEHFVVQRATVGRTTFEPMSSFVGALRKMRQMFEGTGKPYFEKVELITAVITPLEAGFCHVTLAASMRKSRNAYLWGGTALGVGGAVMGAVMVVAGAPEALVVLPMLPAGGGGWLIARAFRSVSSRAYLGLERTLDALEQQPSLAPGTRQGSPPAGRIAREVGQVVREITTEVRKALEEK